MTHEAPQRIFQIGSTRIVEDETTAALTNEQVCELLKRRYPEVRKHLVELQAREAKRYPTADLLPAKRTLKQALGEGD